MILGWCKSCLLVLHKLLMTQKEIFFKDLFYFLTFWWNWLNALYNWSVLWILMAWCFSTRASVATVLSMHSCISKCLSVNTQCKQFAEVLLVSLHLSVCSCMCGQSSVQVKNLSFSGYDAAIHVLGTNITQGWLFHISFFTRYPNIFTLIDFLWKK